MYTAAKRTLKDQEKKRKLLIEIERNKIIAKRMSSRSTSDPLSIKCFQASTLQDGVGSSSTVAGSDPSVPTAIGLLDENKDVPSSSSTLKHLVHSISLSGFDGSPMSQESYVPLKLKPKVDPNLFNVELAKPTTSSGFHESDQKRLSVQINDMGANEKAGDKIKTHAKVKLRKLIFIKSSLQNIDFLVVE